MKRLLSFMFLLNLPLHSMEPKPNYNVIVITSDQQEYTVPRWKVRESNTLYTTFLEKLQECPDILPVCITAPTISHDELHAYSTALDQKNFDDYYKYTLTPDQQRILTNAVGQHVRDNNDELIPKLCDTAMSMKILSLMLDKTMTKECIYPNIPTIECILNYFKRGSIINHIKEKTYVQTYDHYLINDKPIHNKYIPAHKITQKFSDNTRWPILARSKSKNYDFMITESLSTYDVPIPSNKHKLWLFDYTTQKEILLKKIQHRNPIRHTVFSKNNTFLAINSFCHRNGPGQFSLLSLKLENNLLNNSSDIFMIDHPGNIYSFCFNDTSSTIATGLKDMIAFWDIVSHDNHYSLQRTSYTIACPNKAVPHLCFNHDDSRLVTIQNYRDGCDVLHSDVILYDMSDKSNITVLAEIHLAKPQSKQLLLHYDNKGKAFIIANTVQVMILDAQTGLVHINIEEDEPLFFPLVPMFMPELHLLTVLRRDISEANFNTIDVWDMTERTLLTKFTINNNPTSDAYLSPDYKYIYSTELDGSMMQTKFFDKKTIHQPVDNILHDMNIFQIYCLQRIDKTQQQLNPCLNIHRQSLLYKGIKSIPQNVKDVMYNIFHILHAYERQQ